MKIPGLDIGTTTISVVIIENGGGGLRNAGAVANTVLQAAVKEEN